MRYEVYTNRSECSEDMLLLAVVRPSLEYRKHVDKMPLHATIEGEETGNPDAIHHTYM